MMDFDLFKRIIGLIPYGIDFLMSLYEFINTLLISISRKLVVRTKMLIKSCSGIGS